MRRIVDHHALSKLCQREQVLGSLRLVSGSANRTSFHVFNEQFTNRAKRDSILANEKRRSPYTSFSFFSIQPTKALRNGLPTRPFHTRAQSLSISFRFPSP